MRRLLPLALLSLLASALPACASETTDSADPPATSLACDPTAAPSLTLSCIHDFTPGDGAGFGQDNFPEIIYGEPQGGGTHGGSTHVLSLGKGGSITVGFGGATIVDAPGPDFIVFENAFYIGDDPTHPFKELGEISVSPDGETWTPFPCHNESFPFTGCAGWHAVFAGSEEAPTASPYDPATSGGEPYDLADLALPEARFVRVTDLSNFGANPNAGFDLDAITIVHAGP